MRVAGLWRRCASIERASIVERSVVERSVNGTVTHERTGETIEVGSEGFPFIARATATAIARDDLEYDEAWRLRRMVYGAPSMFTIELSYCDEGASD